MFAKIKQLFSDTFAFAIITIGNKLVSFLLLPVYAHYLSKSANGDWNLTNTFTMIVSYLCILGTDAGFAYYYFDEKTESERRSYFTATVLYSVGVSLLLFLLFWGFDDVVAGLIYQKPGYDQVVFYAMLSTVCAIMVQHMLAFTRYSRRVPIFVSMSMFYWIGSSLLNVLFIVVFKQGVLGIFKAQAIGAAMTAFILMVILHRKFTRRFHRKHLKNLIRYGAPLVPSLLSFWVMNSLNGPMIYYMVSPAEAGVFSVAVRLATFIVLVTAAFQMAWRPFAMSIKEREDAPKIFSIVARGLVIVGTVAVMLLAFLIRPIMETIAGAKYAVASPIVWMLSLSILLNSLYGVFSVGLLIMKKTKLIPQPFFFATVLYVIGNAIAIPIYSYWGAAIVLLATYLFLIYYVYFLAQKHYRVPFRMRAITVYLAIYLAAMVGITVVQVNGFTYQWMYDGIALLVVGFSIFVTRLFSIRSVHRLRKPLQALLGVK